MNIAICAPFLEADLLEERIQRAVPEERLFVDEYYSIHSLLALPSLHIYESVWVALPGAPDMEAVRALRERSRELSIVWLSEDEQFVWAGMKCGLTMFLTPQSSDEDFRVAVKGCLRKQEREGRTRLW